MKSTKKYKCLHCNKERSKHKRKFCTLKCYVEARTLPLSVRFWRKVSKTDSCWLWTGAKNKDGCGRIGTIGGKLEKASRVSYSLKYGNIPSGMFVCHRCDNPRCVRPGHLFLGTPRDNTLDMVAKGRGRWLCGESSPVSKITERQALAILKGTRTQKTIAKQYGISQAHVSSIKRRIVWKHLT